MPNVLSGITIDSADPGRLVAFWGIKFQPVPEPKRGKARLHLDVTVEDIEDGIESVLRLGGRSLDQRHDYDEGVVVVMADPEGDEFCLVQCFAPS